MSLSYIANSTVPTAAGAGTAGGGAGVLTLTPPAHNAGDLLVAWVASKPETAGAAPATPSGWTLVSNGEAAGGGGTTGADTGPTRAGWYYKVGDGDTTAVDWTYTAGNCRMGMISVIRSDVGGTFDVAAANGIDSTTGTPFTAAMGTDPGIASGDMVLVYGGTPTDVTTPAQFSNQTLTATGLTSGSATEIAEPETTQGNDLGGVLTRWSPTGGPSSGVATFSADAGGTTTNTRGPIILLRVREVAPVITRRARNTTRRRPPSLARRAATIVRAPIPPAAAPTYVRPTVIAAKGTPRVTLARGARRPWSAILRTPAAAVVATYVRPRIVTGSSPRAAVLAALASRDRQISLRAPLRAGDRQRQLVAQADRGRLFRSARRPLATVLRAPTRSGDRVRALASYADRSRLVRAARRPLGLVLRAPAPAVAPASTAPRPVVGSRAARLPVPRMLRARPTLLRSIVAPVVAYVRPRVLLLSRGGLTRATAARPAPRIIRSARVAPIRVRPVVRSRPRRALTMRAFVARPHVLARSTERPGRPRPVLTDRPRRASEVRAHAYHRPTFTGPSWIATTPVVVIVTGPFDPNAPGGQPSASATVALRDGARGGQAGDRQRLALSGSRSGGQT